MIFLINTYCHGKNSSYYMKIETCNFEIHSLVWPLLALSVSDGYLIYLKK